MKPALGALTALCLLSAGCSPSSPSEPEICPTAPIISEMPPAPDDTEWFDKAADSTLNYAQQLEGFSEAAAESCVTEAGLVWRVVGRDGEMFAVTLDYSPQRVNAMIENSVVTEISVG